MQEEGSRGEGAASSSSIMAKKGGSPSSGQ